MLFHLRQHFLRLCILCSLLILSFSQLFSQGFTQKAQLVVVEMKTPKGPFRVGGKYGLRLYVKNIGRSSWSGQFIAKTSDGSIEQHHQVTKLRPQAVEIFSMSTWSPSHPGQHNMNFYYQTNLEGRGLVLETQGGIRNPFIFNVTGDQPAPTPRLSLQTNLCDFFPNGGGGATTELTVNSSYYGRIMLRNEGRYEFNGTIILRKRDAQGKLHDFIKTKDDPIIIPAGENKYVLTRNYTPEVEANYTIEVYAKPKNGQEIHVGGFRIQTRTATPRLSLQTNLCDFFPNGGGGATTELTVNSSYYGRIMLRNEGRYEFNGTIILRKRDAQGKLHDFIKTKDDPIIIPAGENKYVLTRNYTPEVEANYTIEVYAKLKNGQEIHVGGFRIQTRMPKTKKPFQLSLVTSDCYFIPTKGGGIGTTELQVGTQYFARIMVKNQGEEDFRGKLILRKRDSQGHLSQFINMDEQQQIVAGGKKELFKTRPYTSEKAASFDVEVYAQPSQGAEKFVGRIHVVTHNPSPSGGGSLTPSKADVRLEGDIFFTKMQQSSATTELYRGEYYQLHFKLRNNGSVPFHGKVFTTKRGEETHFLDPYNTDYTIAAGQTVSISTRSLNPGTLGSHTAELWIMPQGERGVRLGSITFVVKDKSSPSPSEPTPPSPRPNNETLVCNTAPEVKNQQGQPVSTLIAGKSYTVVAKITNQSNSPFNDILYLRTSSGQNLAQSNALRINKGQTLPVAFSFIQKTNSSSSLQLAIYSRNNVAYTMVKGSNLSLVYQAVEVVPQAQISISVLSPDINQLVPKEAYPEQTLYYYFLVSDGKKQPVSDISLVAKWEKSGKTIKSSPSTANGLITLSVPMNTGPKATEQDRIVYVAANDSKHNTVQVGTNEFTPLSPVTVLKGHVNDAIERELVLGGEMKVDKRTRSTGSSISGMPLALPGSLTNDFLNDTTISYPHRLRPSAVSTKVNTKYSFNMGVVWERDQYTQQFPLLPEYVKTEAEAGVGVAAKFSFGLQRGPQLVKNFLSNLLSAEAKASTIIKVSTKFNVRSAANTLVGVALTSLRSITAEQLNPERKWVQGALSMLDTGIDYTMQRMNPIKGEVGASVSAKISGEGKANMPKWKGIPKDFQSINVEGSAEYKLSFSEKYIQIGNEQSDLHESFGFKAYAEGSLSSPLLDKENKSWGNKSLVSLETTTKRKIYGVSNFENYGASMKYTFASIPSAENVRFVSGFDVGQISMKGAINLKPELQPSETIDYGGKIYSNLWSQGQSSFYGIVLNKSRLRDYLKNQRFLQPQLSDLKEGVKITEQNKVEVQGEWEIDEFSLYGTDLKLFLEDQKGKLSKLPIPFVDISLKYKFPPHRNSYYHEQVKDYLTTDSYTPRPDLSHATAQRVQDDVQKMWNFMGTQFKNGLNDVAVWCREKGIQLVGEFGNSIVEYTNKTRNYLTSLFGGSSGNGDNGDTAWTRGLETKQSDDTQFSRIKFTFEGNGKVFPLGTHYDFSHTYPAGQATGTVAESGEKFVVISDIFYLNAESSEGKSFLAAPNGTFSVISSVGRDDLASLSLDPRSKVMLYHLPQGNDPSQWEIVGPVGQRLQCRGLGCYALGVQMQKDQLPPIINCRVDASQRQLIVEVRDNEGVNWNSVTIVVNGQLRTFRPSEQNGQVLVRLFDADLKDLDNINIWVTASDLANNTARFAQSPQPSAIATSQTTDVPTCRCDNGTWTLLTNAAWQGADYRIISLNGTTLFHGKIDAERLVLPTSTLPVGTFLLRLSQAHRTHTTTFINSKR